MLRIILCLVLATLAAAADWHVGLKSAADQAKKSKLPILADFTGSDWCGWCVKLKKEVFDTPEFAAWATKHVVLLEVDFPQANPLPQAQATENDQLAAKYKVEGFPTIILFSAAGAEIGRLGYVEGGPQAWIAKAEAILKAKR